MASVPSSDELRPIVLHSSWRGRLTALFAPGTLLVLGTYGIAFGGLQVLNGIIFGLGAVLMLVVLFDFPIWCEFGESGVVRHCAFRKQQLEWQQIRAIVRPANQGPVGRRRASRTGLVAEIGKKPFLLVDRIESRAEHEALERAVRRWKPGFAFRPSKPSMEVSPTWLYKRRRGRAGNALVDEV